MGKGSVLRAGGNIVYDNYGNAMAGASQPTVRPAWPPPSRSW